MSSSGERMSSPGEREFAEGVEGIREGRASKGTDGIWRFETLKKRKCKDPACLVIFAASWVVAALLTAQALRDGNPKRLIYAVDYKGDVCGVGNESENEFIYYPALHSMLMPVGRCLPRCPEKGERVCVPINFQLTESVGAKFETCDVLASDSTNFMFRCLRSVKYTELLTVQCTAWLGSQDL